MADEQGCPPTDTIDHSTHAHEATPAAREKCRRELARYPSGQRPGSVFRDDDGSLWQRLTVSAEQVERDDSISGFQVVGVSSDARHDNQPAYRYDLHQEGSTGRLVVQASTELWIHRPYDPEREELSVEIEIDDKDSGGAGADPIRMLNYLLGLVGKTGVQPQVMSWSSADRVAQVRLVGPRRDVAQVLRTFSPDGWEAILLDAQPVVQPLKYNFHDWQRTRIEQWLRNHDGERWVPERVSLNPRETPEKTIFNQDMRDGWRLSTPTGKGPRFVGRELMAALLEQYGELIDAPDGFIP